MQIAGSKPGVLVPTAEQIVKHCDIDFLGQSLMRKRYAHSSG